MGRFAYPNHMLMVPTDGRHGGVPSRPVIRCVTASPHRAQPEGHGRVEKFRPLLIDRELRSRYRSAEFDPKPRALNLCLLYETDNHRPHKGRAGR